MEILVRSVISLLRLDPVKKCICLFLMFFVASAFSRTVIKQDHPSSLNTFETIEITLNVADTAYSNPFQDVTVTAVFTRPDAQTVPVLGFCDSADGSIYRFRYTPPVAGSYSYQLTFQDSLGTETFSGAFSVQQGSANGFIRVDPSYRHFFKFSNGGHPFICSKTAWMIGMFSNEPLEAFLDKMLPRKENCIRFGIECDHFKDELNADVWPWGGSRATPDYDRFNVEAWQKLDRVVQEAQERGIYSEMVVFTNPDHIISWYRTKLYLDYIAARLAPFPSVILLQTFNEDASDYLFQRDMRDYFVTRDPCLHLWAPSHGTSADAAWPNESWVDVAINHYCMGSSVPLSDYYSVARTISNYNKPAWSDETGREVRHGNNDGVHRRKQYWTWNIGGAFWNYHSAEGCEKINDITYNGPGWEYLQYIRPFWEQTEFWKLLPSDVTILNNPASDYEHCVISDSELVVYFANETTGATTNSGFINIALPEGVFNAEFYNPSNGSWFPDYKNVNLIGDQTLSIHFPTFTDDLILYLYATGHDRPIMILSPEIGEFPQLQPGETDTTTIAISNDGLQTLQISSLFLSGSNSSQFSILQPSTPFSVIANGSRDVVIQFVPLDTDLKSADLNIIGNDPIRPAAIVPLVGNIPIDEEFDSPTLLGYKTHVPVTGPHFDLQSRPGYLRLSVPSTTTYDHWSSTDRAPQLRRTSMDGDWAVQTKLELFSSSGSKYHTGLMIYFSKYDLFYWGFQNSINQINLARSGDAGLITKSFASGATVELQITKEGTTYTFFYRTPGTGDWIIAGTQVVAAQPVYVGLITKTWVAVNVVSDFDFLRVQKLALEIITSSLPDGELGQSYNVQLQGRRGVLPYEWSILSGDLPPGLSFNHATGLLNGTPSECGTFSFTVQLEDQADPPATAACQYSITIESIPLAILPPFLPSGTIGHVYTAKLQARGGTPPYSWAVNIGQLPPGLVLDSQKGHITGVPTSTGAFSFNAQVTDSQIPPVQISCALTIRINPVISPSPVPPPWVFEPWVWEDNINTEVALRSLVAGYQDRDIPVGAVIVDSPWETNYNTFVFESDYYPSAQQMINDFHNMGIKVVSWITPLINIYSTDGPNRNKASNYDEALLNDYFIDDGATFTWWKGAGSFIDYTNPDAVAWWHQQMDVILDMGLDGWKPDAGTRLFPDSGACFAGTISKKDYTRLYYQDFYEYTIHKRGNQCISLTKPYDENPADSTYVPREFTSIAWVGDQEHVWDDDGMLNAMSNIFLCGQKKFIAAGSDIGGFFGDKPIEKGLLIRWGQFGALCPFMENGGGGEHRPWMFDAETVEIYRYFAKLHHQLVPYLYSHAVDASNNGTSLVTQQPGEWQYKLGPDLFVSTVILDYTQRSVLFPNGDDWIHYWHETTCSQGGTTVSYYVPRNQYPIFIRKGAIIPMRVSDAVTGHGTSASTGYLTMLVFPSTSSIFTFHQFDKGDITFNCMDGGDSITLSISASSENYIFRVVKTEAPTVVKLGAVALEQKTTFSTFEAASSGWYYNSETSHLWIKFNSAGSAQTIKILNTPLPLSMVTASCPNGNLNVPYSVTLQASGGVAPYQWSVTGNLPPSLSLNGTTGQISGFPTVLGSYEFTISVQDSDSPPGQAQRQFSVTISEQPVIDEEFVTGSSYGYEAYIPKSGPSFSLDAMPGYLYLTVPSTAIYGHWTDKDEAPQWRRALSGGDWQAESKVHLAANSGSNFLVGMMVYFSRYDCFYWGYNPDITAIRINRSGASNPTIVSYSGGRTVELRIRKVSTTYYFDYRTEGATTWINAGSRTATQTPVYIGFLAKTVKNIALTIDFDYLRLGGSTLEIATASLSDGYVGTAYNAQLQAQGGVQPYTWTLSDGALPDGLNLSSTGVISGTPTTTDTTNFTVLVQDSSAPVKSMTKEYSMAVQMQSVIDEEFVTGSSYGYEAYIPKSGPSFSLDAMPGYLYLTVPSTAIYGHWTDKDEAPQWRRSLPGGDWQAESRVHLAANSGSNLLVGMMVYFSRYDCFYWGYNPDITAIRINRSGASNPTIVSYSGGRTVELRIRKVSTTYYFDYRTEGATTWINAGSRTATQTPVYIGFLAKTVTTISLTADFDYLRLVAGSGSSHFAYSESSSQDVFLLPTEFSLSQAYPNPFNPETRLTLALTQNDRVSAIVYNTIGQQIRFLFDGMLNAGYHDLLWDATDDQGMHVQSGVYFILIKTGEGDFTRKVILIK